jgi:uncharacterized BrkB/YihY/UPF0761 family membrane protein
MALNAYFERLFRLDWHPVQVSLARGKATVQHVVMVGVEKFQDDLVSLRAASLTYTTLLSLVP